MVNFNTTPSSTKFIGSLVDEGNMMLVMDGLLSSKSSITSQDALYVKTNPISTDSSVYQDKVYRVVSKEMFNNEPLVTIQDTSTLEKYYISESLFKLEYKEF